MTPTLSDALKGLYARVPLGMRFGLDPMRAACVRAGNPERSFKSVHIGGTNGKGSTCAMVESIARGGRGSESSSDSAVPARENERARGGRRTGLYTSPHLIRVAERIRIDGEPISDEMLTRVLEEALAVGVDLSFFETATFAAFLAFREAKVDLAVVEVGIGGRLDATNVLESPLVTAITGVALDHQDMLGDTLDLIAREKASIAKRGVPLVLGPEMPEEARRAVLEIAREHHATIVETTPMPDDVAVGLEGDHQRKNAAVAWTIANELGIDEATRRSGLASAKWPGRLERIKTAEGEWLLDGAHNPEGARALVNALAKETIGAIVFGALEDKAWREMLDIIAELNAPRIYAQPAGRAPAPLKSLVGRASGTATRSVADALEEARRRAGLDRVVVICGSLYLIGEARSRLLALPMDTIVAL